MRTNTMIRATMLAAALGLSGSVFADTFVTTGVGTKWSQLSSWSQNGGAPARLPGASDNITISHDLDLDDGRAAANLTVDSSVALVVYGSGSLTMSNGAVTISANGGVIDFQSGTYFAITSGQVAVAITNGAVFDIENGASVVVSGNSPGLTVSGVFEVEGDVSLDSSSGAPFVILQTSQTFPRANGRLLGLASAAVQPEFLIDANAGSRTITNQGEISGDLVIAGINTSSHNASFANDGTVTANVAGTMLMDASLFTVSSTSNAFWKVQSSGSARLTFDRASTNFLGALQVLVSGGIVDINDSITYSTSSGPAVTYNVGRINIDSGMSLRYGSFGGSCGYTPPNNPLTHANSPINTCP